MVSGAHRVAALTPAVERLPNQREVGLFELALVAQRPRRALGEDLRVRDRVAVKRRELRLEFLQFGFGAGAGLIVLGRPGMKERRKCEQRDEGDQARSSTRRVGSIHNHITAPRTETTHERASPLFHPK